MGLIVREDAAELGSAALNKERIATNIAVREGLARQCQMAAELFGAFESAPLAAILLDASLRVKLFTPKIRDWFALADTDAGRPFMDVAPKFLDGDLVKDVLAVAATGAPRECKKQGESGAGYIRSVIARKALAGEPKGIMIVYANINEIEQLEMPVAEANDYNGLILSPASAGEFDVMRILHERSARLVENGDLAAFLSEILNAVVSLQKADCGDIRVYDSVRGILPIAAQKDFPPQFLEYFAQMDTRKDSAYSRALREGRRIIVDDMMLNENCGSDREFMAQAGFRAMQSSPVFVHGGAVEYILSTYFKVPHVPSERDLRLTDVCLRMAAERIAQIKTNEELRAARLAVEQANKMKTKFLAAVGHDLRQPLQTIGLLKAVMERQVVNPQAYTTLIKLGNAVGHMQELVDSLLDVNLIESGAVQVDLESLALGPILARVARDFEPAAMAKGLELRHVQSSFLVRGDGRLLARILDNLVSNAIKFTDRGKILLGCRRRGADVLLEIWDTGIGIPPENSGSIFNEFQRGRHEGVERSGCGLGLYIVRRFAEQLGYKMELRSMPGKGSVFSLVIPHQLIVGGGEPDGAVPDSGAGLPYVLLLESNSTQRDALEALLQIEGYCSIAVSDGATALAELEHIPPGVALIIVADHDPGAGMDVIGIIQKAASLMRRKIPSLLLSARDPGLVDIERAGPNCQFIAKPANPAYLLAVIENAIRLYRPSWYSGMGARQHLAVTPAVSHSPDAELAVIDDDAGICDAICAILEPGGYKVESFLSAEAYLADARRSRFKCLIADIGLPGMSGMALLARLRGFMEWPQVIILSGDADWTIAAEALRDGAADFLRKPVQGTALLQSVANALRHGREALVMDPAQQADIVARLGRLTGREREVLARVVKGELNKNIAADLGISERTTEHHRQNVMRKMGVKSLAMLVHMMSSWKGHEI